MSNRFRKAIAVSEVAGGGLALLSDVLFAHAGALSMLELVVLGILGALSIMAGIALWKNDMLGHRVSIALQAAQVIQVQSAALTYKVLLGVQLVVWIREGGRLGIAPGLGGLFSIGADPADFWWLGLNVWALVALIALIARPTTNVSNKGGAELSESLAPAQSVAAKSRPTA
jgi:hypothetical protein